MSLETFPITASEQAAAANYLRGMAQTAAKDGSTLSVLVEHLRTAVGRNLSASELHAVLDGNNARVLNNVADDFVRAGRNLPALPAPPPGPGPPSWWQFWRSDITPAQSCSTLRWSSGIGLAASLFTGGFGANFDTALMIGGILTLVPGMQWLFPIVAAGYLFKAGQHAIQGLGCLFGGLLGGETDIQGAFMNFGTAFLVAVYAFPVAKAAQVSALFKGRTSMSQFLTKSTELCYGKEAAAQLATKLEMFSANSAARQTALANGRVGLERARDTIYSFFNPGYVPPSVARAAATPAGFQFTSGGVLVPA